MDLLSRTGPNKFDSLRSMGIQLNQSCAKQPQENLASSIDSSQIQELEDIIDSIAQSQSNVRQQYAHDLKQSLETWKKLKRSPKNTLVSIDADMLSAEIINAQRATNDQFDRICEAFKKGDRRAEWLGIGGLGPCVTPVTLLEILRSTSTYNFGTGMKESIVAYAVSVTTLQQLMRMEDAIKKNNTRELSEEMQTIGHENWRPLEHPDWLLLELDQPIACQHGNIPVPLRTRIRWS